MAALLHCGGASLRKAPSLPDLSPRSLQIGHFGIDMAPALLRTELHRDHLMATISHRLAKWSCHHHDLGRAELFHFYLAVSLIVSERINPSRGLLSLIPTTIDRHSAECRSKNGLRRCSIAMVSY